jgi:AcrR family transcriptional regulator
MFDSGQRGVHCLKLLIMPVKTRTHDRRASRTRQALSDALVSLIREKRWDTITVQHVIDRANVGRSTFYAHYRDKEDLLRCTFDEFLDRFGSGINWENLESGRVVPILELFTHLQDEFHRFYRALVRSRKTDLLFRIGPGQMAKCIEQSLTSWVADRAQPSVPIPVLANYLASAILSMLKWWLDQNMPYPPERMDQLFHELVMPGLRSTLGTSPAQVKKQSAVSDCK